MINKNKFRLTLTFLALLLLFSILFIFFGNREVYVVSKDKSFGEPQKGYIIQVDTKKVRYLL